MRILLADDQPGVRFALARLLRRQPGVKLAGEAACAAECLAGARAQAVDLVLLDWELPGASAGLLECLRKIHPGLAVIALSGRPEAGPDALAAGADAFVSKGEPAEQLLAAIARLAPTRARMPEQDSG